jgi:hypothetical protein
MTETEKTSRDLRRQITKAARNKVLYSLWIAFRKVLWQLILIAITLPILALLVGVMAKVCYYAFLLTWGLF